jgi:hypothetical protein
LNTISVKIEPHDCIIYKIVPVTDKTVMQAEVAAYSRGVEFSKSVTGYHGYGYLDSIDSEGDSVTFAFQASKMGSYQIAFNYLSEQKSAASICVREVESAMTTFSKEVTLDSSDSKWKTTGTSIELQKGINLVTVQYSKGKFGLDSVEFKNVSKNSGGKTLRHTLLIVFIPVFAAVLIITSRYLMKRR